ncbi:MAG: sulfite exporter TauE/SafE family protein [Candidatus Aminicenantia bacterium]
MKVDVIIVLGMIVLSTISGMLGLGVAFAAIPFLGIFFEDLVHQVQPLSLLLNGITALFSTIGFARSGFVDWEKAITLAVVTTIFAPVGALLAQIISPMYIWFIYFFAVLYLAFRLFKPVKEREGKENFVLTIVLAIPISILSGFLGVGPGFLLMPTLILAGFDSKKAAGINAFAVFPPSFSALIPHLSSAVWSGSITLILLFVGAIFAFVGARFSSLYLPSKNLKAMFALLIVIVTLYKIFTLFRY